ncbi:hypothetical protein HK099_003031 [Clydaea vesicula]|uniref:Uncharacterized protein n=1 Tax=Clydaea vesicula TaxID=447962 RepID=A0AAD5Y0H1_9FUNG|nr:hypothetical protein HK099_003031 [Clydaea vesicula]
MSTGFTAFIVVLTLVSLLSMLGLIYFFKKRNKSDKLDGSEALNFNLNHHKLGDGSYHPSLTSGFLVNSGAVGYNDRIHNKLKYNNNSTSAPRSEGYSYSESSFGAGSSIVNTPYPYQNYPLGLGYSDDIKKLNVNH